MKTILTVSLAAFLSVGLVDFAFASPQTEGSINAIRQQYAAINKRLGKYRRVKKRLSGFSLEGGELTAYFQGPAIMKIVAMHYGEGGRTLEEYYYRDGKLIFVFEKVFQYDRPLSGKVVSTIETRFYYDNDKLIRWLDEKGLPAVVDAEHRALKSREWLANSNKFITAARSKKHTVEA
ncbi:MAG: hypothetical protein M3539_04535 [Acidobacteriota bacterium]|nr:hypothetical protein [Acidobacteriota bacterium]